MPERPQLSDELMQKILDFPEFRMGAHLVHLHLRSGRRIDDVVVAWGTGIVRVGQTDRIDFDPRDVVDVESAV